LKSAFARSGLNFDFDLQPPSLPNLLTGSKNPTKEGIENVVVSRSQFAPTNLSFFLMAKKLTLKQSQAEEERGEGGIGNQLLKSSEM